MVLFGQAPSNLLISASLGYMSKNFQSETLYGSIPLIDFITGIARRMGRSTVMKTRNIQEKQFS